MRGTFRDHLRSVYFGKIRYPIWDTKRIVKKGEHVSKSVLCANATKRIVAFPGHNSTIRFVVMKSGKSGTTNRFVWLVKREVSFPTADLKPKVGRHFTKIRLRRWVEPHRWGRGSYKEGRVYVAHRIGRVMKWQRQVSEKTGARIRD